MPILCNAGPSPAREDSRHKPARACGFAMRASDISPRSVARLKAEAAKRGLRIDASVCDIRQLWAHRGREFDVVISCDNSLPH